MKIRALFIILAILTGILPGGGSGFRAAGDYFIYVLSEAADVVSVIRFGPAGAKLEREFKIGIMEPDIDGPHGIAFSPDRRNYFVSLGHGRPFGSVWKYSTEGDKVLKKVTLGPFPATMDVSPDGNFLYVVNFNLHGDMIASSVSVVVADEMLEIKRIPTCTMPHGSRFNPQGTRHYSACMMDDMLVEIDASTLAVSRHFMLTKGKEMGMNGSPAAMARAKPGAHRGTSGAQDHGGHGLEAPKSGDVGCSPTWAQPSSDGKTIFVACNKSSEIVEIDAASWKVLRRIEAGPGVYNLAVTKNGKLIATNKRGPSVSIYDIKSGRELARLPTLRKVVHGAAVSSDDRYAFISVEGIGSEPGTVEIIDLAALKTVARVDVAPQAAGIEVR